MASSSSRAREGGEGITHRTIPEHRPDPDRPGCDPTGCGDGPARPWPERGRLGDAEAVGHRGRFRKGNFQPKQHLGHLVEKLKLLDLEGEREEKEHLCSWRKRAIAFGGDAEASGSSREGPEACGSPARADGEESAREDREQLHSDLEKLKKRREEIWELQISGERRCQDYLRQTEVERQKIVSEFRQLRRFLKDQELVLLARLGELDREMMRRREEEETKIRGEISLLDVLICAVQEKLEQPASRFLQDARRPGDRWEMDRAQRTAETFSELERRLHVISQQNCVLREMLGRFQDVLLSEREKEQGPLLGGDRKAFVTLDPDTANTRLVLSRDRRGVRWTDAGQDLPTIPQRFDPSCCILGCQGFTAGRHCWEVEVAGGRSWALGVARRSVPRKGWIEFQPAKGIWAMGRCGNRYRVFTSPITTFPATAETGRVRVALDYGGGQVAFYLAEREPPIFMFRKASFGGESIFPFFWVGRGSRLRLCP